MIHAAAPHFLWPFAVQYAAHQINLKPQVSVPETTPTLRWTGKVGDASAFRVWGSRAFDHDLSANKLSSHAGPCDVMFDESVPYYRLFPYRTAPLPPSPLFLAPGPPPVDPLPPQGPAPSAVSQVDAVEPVEVTVDSSAARGIEPAGAGFGGAEPERAEPGGAESGGAEPGVAESGGAEPEGAEPVRVDSGGAAPGGPSGASSRREPLSPQQLREWFCRRWSRATGAGGATGSGGPAAAGAAGGSGATGPGGARTGGTRAAGPGGAAGAGVAGGASPGAASAAGASGGPAGAGAPRGAGAGGAAGAGALGGAGVGATGAAGGAGGAGGARGVGADAGGAGAVPAESGGVARLRPYFVPLLEQRASPLPAPSPYTGPTGGLTERLGPESRPALPVRAARTGRRSSHQRPPPVPGTHQMALRPSTALHRVPLPSPPESSLPALADPESDSLRAASPTVTRLLATVITDPSFESTVASALGDPDAPDIPTPRSYAEAIEGPYSSQWQTVMDAEMASWKSTGTYVHEVPPPGANIVDSMWIFRVKRPPGSPPVFKARYVAQGFRQRQGRDYELHSLDFSTAFLQGSLHEEIWLRRPPGFTGSFPPGTQWSLRRPVYGLRQAPREWHDTLRTTLAALGFAPSTADPTLFLRTDTALSPFYILVYVDDLVFATADTAGLVHVKSELQKRHTCTGLGELHSYLGLQITRDRARRTITLTQSHMVHQVLQCFNFTYSSPLSTRQLLSALPSDESVVPSGPYPELVGCLMYLMTCTQPDLAYPLSILARYVAPGRHRPEHMDAAKRVLRYLSRCEAEIYAGAMAAQELHWLTYLLTDLGEPPLSPLVLYVDNKAMLALCQEHRLEHITKHIALRYFLARELQQRGQLRLAYVATRANTTDIL
ncbi:unnamed protein product [Closterium sp. NIES-54]